jgi:hypothetical protein
LSETGLQALRQRIEIFPLDEPGAVLPFTRRLAREQGWTHAFAGWVVRESRRFLYLAMAAGHPVTPSEEVDQEWHLHLVYTRRYWQTLCKEILGRVLHHEPTSGGQRESAKFVDWYSKTLESCQRLFGGPAPTDIWPDSAKRFNGGSGNRWIEGRKYGLIPRPSFSRLEFWKRLNRPRS